MSDNKQQELTAHRTGTTPFSRTSQAQATQRKNPGAAGPKIRWDATHLKNSYANVCNISFTREEVILLFGINQALQGGAKDVTVQLNERIILSPFAAKRLHTVLTTIIGEYESRFGALSDGPKAK